MSAITTPQTPQTKETPPAPAQGEATAEPTLDSALPADLLAEAGQVADARTEPPAEGDAAADAGAEAAPDKLAVATETLRKARKIAKSRREAEAKAERERLRADQFAQRADQERKEREASRAELESFRKDPLQAIKSLGVTARQLADKAIEEGTPEAKFAAIEARHAAENAAIREELAALKKERETERQGAQEAGARAQFFALLTPESHPRLHGLDRSMVLAMAKSAFDNARSRGHSPTDRQVLDYVESVLSAPQGVPAGTSTPKPNPGTTVAKPVAKPSPASRTVTADLASRRYTAPANLNDLDLHDQKAALARMIEEAERGS
jgi:hypothetical protein